MDWFFKVVSWFFHGFWLVSIVFQSGFMVSLGFMVLRSVGAIPDVCHFFTRAKFLVNKIYTKKRQFFRQICKKTPLFFATFFALNL